MCEIELLSFVSVVDLFFKKFQGKLVRIQNNFGSITKTENTHSYDASRPSIQLRVNGGRLCVIVTLGRVTVDVATDLWWEISWKNINTIAIH